MKKLVIISLALVGVLSTASGQKTILDKVVATVGGEYVLFSEVEEQFALLQSQTPNAPASARCSVLEQLLAGKLLLNQAKLDSIAVADEEVEDQLNARIDRILSYMNGDVSQFEDYYGQSIGEVKDQFREDLRNQLLVERMRAQVLDEVTVTPSEVRTFFSQVPNDSLPYFSSEVEIGEVVYRPQVNPEERQKSIARLEDIRTRILNGEVTFEEMASKFSDDGSARIGGDLGWAKRGKFVPEFEAAAFSLEPGEISPVVETEFGFHLIKLLERRGNSINVKHILVRPAITETDLEKAAMHLDSVRQLIRSDSINFSQAVKRFGYKEVQSYNNDGRMMNQGTGNTFFEIGDLEPDVYFAIDTMTVGSVSAPMEFKDPGGETYYRIIQLQSRTAPHRASLQLDYSRIRDAAKQSKQNEYLNSWLEEKIESTYIYIDPMYDGCENLDLWREKSRAKP
jgi:peptidyl-prolyl cis-trans isomerase SurA